MGEQAQARLAPTLPGTQERHSVPQDTFLRVFRALDPKQFEAAFRRWTGGIVGALDGSIAIDGKTLRRSADGNASPVHMVSAFATDLGLVLGQEKVSSKSNEITAIPELLEALHIKGLLVSIDAMGCQREIAEKIVHKGRRLPARGQGQSARSTRRGCAI